MQYHVVLTDKLPGCVHKCILDIALDKIKRDECQMIVMVTYHELCHLKSVCLLNV